MGRANKSRPVGVGTACLSYAIRAGCPAAARSSTLRQTSAAKLRPILRMDLINWLLFGVFMVIAAWKVFKHFRGSAGASRREDP
jgi:hypothetical protein